jgi:NADPH-dependent 2,4-dienoyl-CoA reductase/sulfur reductase-like enzyme
MTTHRYVILGGGLVAGYAAQAFAEVEEKDGRLYIISAESNLPYERPPLSKDFLAGEKDEEEILINKANFYSDNEIDVRLDTRIKNVDLLHKKLYTADDEVIEFDKLLIATGSQPRKFDVSGSGLTGLYYLRQVDDAQHIRQAAKDAKKAVVIGGSFIGMEVASVLQGRGVATTLVFPEARVWQSFFTPEMSEFFEKYYQEKGVTIMPQATVASFEGSNGRLSHVILEDGTRLAADMAVAGIGVTPNSELFQDDLRLEKGGIIVNRYLQTSQSDVYAAGDVARYEDILFDEARRVEHWDNAVAQGERAIKNMVGEREAFVHVPYFFSDVFDLSYEFWGDTSHGQDVVYRGDVSEGQFSTWWLNEDGRLVAAFVMDRPDEERDLAPLWIKEKKKLDADDLGDGRRKLEKMES